MNIIEDAPIPHEGFSPWIAYDGTGCPLDDKTRVQVKCAHETWEEAQSLALRSWYDRFPDHLPANEWDWEWNRDLDETDIVAFSFFLDDEEN